MSCRLLIEAATFEDRHRKSLEEYSTAGVEVRQASSLPMKLALFDGRRGMVALLDPVLTRPAWTAVVFDHEGMGQAMQGLFEDDWRRGTGSGRRLQPRVITGSSPPASGRCHPDPPECKAANARPVRQ